MDSNVKVSVIIPMYNAEKTIQRTLDSVIYQTFHNLEIIVVNDGSTDNSNTSVNKYIEDKLGSDINITLICKTNGGVSSARNNGMAIAKGEFIALLDSDDEWLPHKLDSQLEVINNNTNIDFLGANRTNESVKKIFLKKIDHLTRILVKDILYKNVFVTSSVIFRRSILSEVGCFDETRNYGEDALFFIKICQNKNCFLLNEPLVFFGGGKVCFGDSGLSKNLWSMEKGELMNINYAYRTGVIHFYEFIFIYLLSISKFFRRVWLSRVVKNCFI